jgi:hypothetical protein
MDQDRRIDRALSVLTRRGAYDVLHVMRNYDGTAAYAQIAAVTRPALTLLRALAAEGFVSSYQSGSLDIEPLATTSFYLTAKGEAVAGHLEGLSEWAATRSRRRNWRVRW